MELPAFRREGSNKHINGCEHASQQLKFEIRALDNKERERAAVLSSLHDMESILRALDEEEWEIESAFPDSIRGEPSSLYAGGNKGVREATKVKLFKSVKCSQRWYTF
ncbi:hypothetical protein R1flu_011947 [Riccia fluitans]|uniref:Uncharacterized protein n=1 Tax=Riccia fluitans TaxID=41844 RepID=A0ABD1ZA54_9MARC